jgi:hypothetical protein
MHHMEIGNDDISSEKHYEEKKQSIPEDRDPVLGLKMQIFMKTNPKNAHFLSNHFQLALKR